MAIQIKEDNLNSNTLQSGLGIPSHLATIGTLFTDISSGTVYINKNGLGLWSNLLTNSASTGVISSFSYNSTNNTFTITDIVNSYTAEINNVSGLTVSSTFTSSGTTRIANSASNKVLLGSTPATGSYSNGTIPDGLTINSDSGGISFLRPTDYAQMIALKVIDSSTMRVGGGNQNFVDIYGHTSFISRFSNSPTPRVGILTSSPQFTLDVSGDTRIVSGLTANTVVISGLTTQSSNTFLVTANSSGTLNRFGGSVASRVPYFNTSSAITTDSNFTYDGNGTLTLNNTTTSQLIFDGGRGGILCNGGPGVNLTFEMSFGQTGVPDTTKGFLFRNKQSNNYLLLNSPSATQHLATFYGTVSVAPTTSVVRSYWGTSGLGLQVASATYGDSSSSSSAGDLAINTFAVPTITANTSTTYDALSTVYIAGPPTLGTNVSGTRYALKVNSGDVLFNGTVTITGGTSSISLTNPTQQQIKFFSGGTGTPQLSTYSAGAKIILYDNIDASISTGFAIGVDAGILWYGADLTGNGHEWYAGTKKLSRLVTSDGYQLLGLGGPTTVAMTISGTSSLGSKGGLGYMDFLRVYNNYPSATNPNKWFRTTSGGTLEILRNDYNATILTITDGGIMSVGGGNVASVTSNDATTNYLSFNNNNTQIYDDGNTHIHSRSAGASMWINTNGGQLNLLTQSPTSTGGIGSGIAIATGTLNGYVTINTGRTITTAAAYGYLTTGGAGTYPGGSQSVSISLYANNRIWGQEIDAFSDERMKDIQGNINLEEGIKLVKNLNPIKYTWKEGDDKGVKAGYSAQQVIKSGFDHLIGIIPKDGLEETVDSDGFVSPKDTQFSMNYDQVVPYHGVVLKHLLEKIELLEKEIKELKAK